MHLIFIIFTLFNITEASKCNFSMYNGKIRISESGELIKIKDEYFLVKKRSHLKPNRIKIVDTKKILDRYYSDTKNIIIQIIDEGSDKADIFVWEYRKKSPARCDKQIVSVTVDKITENIFAD